MKMSFRKIVVVLLAVLILLPIAAYWLADSWLESSGGRRLLEQTLSRRIGMNVRLEGEFDLMLLPAIGVTGTELVIGGPEAGSEFARSHEYEISVALKPLLDRKIFVEWIRLTGGSIHPNRYTRTDRIDIVDPVVGADSSANLVLPEIQELTIRNFEIQFADKNETRLKVKELTLTNFSKPKHPVHPGDRRPACCQWRLTLGHGSIPHPSRNITTGPCRADGQWCSLPVFAISGLPAF